MIEIHFYGEFEIMNHEIIGGNYYDIDDVNDIYLKDDGKGSSYITRDFRGVWVVTKFVKESIRKF